MWRNKVRLLAPVVLAAGLAAGTAHAQAVPAAVGDVQLVTGGSLYGYPLNHTIRYANGSWQHFGQLTDLRNTAISGLTSAIVNGEEHVFFQYHNYSPFYANIVHVIPHADGTWNLNASAPQSLDTTTPPTDGHLGAANVNGVLNLVRLHANKVQNSVQNADGTWSAWTDVPITGSFGSVAVTGNGSDLRIVATATDGATLTQTDHHADGTWSPARQTAFTTDIGQGKATNLSVAEVGDDLEVVALGDNSGAYHSIMHLNGSWDLFRNVSGPAGNPSQVISIAVAASRGALQLAVGTSDGGLFHAIRYADGSWQPYGNVEHEAGTPNGIVGQLTLAGQ